MYVGSPLAIPSRRYLASDADTPSWPLVAVNPSVSVPLASLFCDALFNHRIILARGSDGFPISTRQALNVGAPVVRACACESVSPTLWRDDAARAAARGAGRRVERLNGNHIVYIERRYRRPSQDFLAAVDDEKTFELDTDNGKL